MGPRCGEMVAVHRWAMQAGRKAYAGGGTQVVGNEGTGYLEVAGGDDPVVV